jgi:hypothetical protein
MESDAQRYWIRMLYARGLGAILLAPKDSEVNRCELNLYAFSHSQG